MLNLWSGRSAALSLPPRPWRNLCWRGVPSTDYVHRSSRDGIVSIQWKYVLFAGDSNNGNRDHFRYEAVRYAVQALHEPFDDWDVKQTTARQPHSYFTGVGRNEQCPCESGKKYKKCCLLESGVLRPHMEFTLSVPPPRASPGSGSPESYVTNHVAKASWAISTFALNHGFDWSGRRDSNSRPPAPKAGALPGCATPRHLLLFSF